MIVYASDVSFGSSSAITGIQADVDSVNQAFINSGIPVTIDLVHAEQVFYVSTGDYYTDLKRLETAGDGYMDNIASLRQQYKADLVCLYVNVLGAAGPDDPPGTQLVGLGNELTIATGWTASAFTMVYAPSAGSEQLTLAHELGHNFGASHDAKNDPQKNPAFPSGEGYRFTGGDGVLYHDIMSYDPGQTIPYFSNPAITYADVAEGRAGRADAAHVIMKTAPIVANYHNLISPTVGDHLPKGGIDVHTISTISGWAFDADAGAGAVQVRMDIDRVLGRVITADLDRPDLASTLGSGDHGFSFDLAGLPVGGAYDHGLCLQ